MEELIQSLPKLLRAAGEAEEVVEAAAFVAWRRVAGEALRGCAVPFRLYRKTLVVAVPDTTWRKQLEAVSGQLIFRLNSLLGQALVTYIEFRVDQKTVQQERERTPRAAHEATPEEAEHALRGAGELRAAATAIRDEDLRRRFLLAAGSYINAQERK
ncbi:MAG TPA: DUF721 domain-containing protein [Pyrinomonadaceae bacterium]|nr:DUF721 domain-containing protein [Pyrinomonadaceae bacterium]